MSRRDFLLIAETIREAPHLAGESRRRLVELFADRLEAAHPRFRRDLFLRAALANLPNTKEDTTR